MRLRSRPLQTGDLVGVATPSSPGPALYPRRLARALQQLRRAGFQPVLGPRSRAGAGHTAGTAAERAEELNEFIRDHRIRAIFISLGGYTSNGILASLDFDALARHPKILVGYSDFSCVLLAVWAVTGLVTFHGPTVLPELGEYPAPFDYTLDHLWAAVGRAAPLGRLRPPNRVTDELLLWEEEDDRPRVTRPTTSWRWLRPGRASGVLLGGNLETLETLLGTPYMPSLKGAVLFWETTSCSLGEISRSLVHLQLAGALTGIRAMIVGRAFRAPANFDDELDKLVTETTADLRGPVLTRVDLGHTDPMMTLPLGVTAEVDAERNLFCIVEPAVWQT